MSPEGFDCSGFVRFVLSTAGLDIPDYIGLDGQTRSIRHANEFWDYYGVAVHPSKRQPGDLLFFSRNGAFPTHIGIVLSDVSSYIHAQHEAQVTTAPITPYTIGTLATGSVLYTKNPIGYKRPTTRLESPTYRYHQQPISAQPIRDNN